MGRAEDDDIEWNELINDPKRLAQFRANSEFMRPKPTPPKSKTYEFFMTFFFAGVLTVILIVLMFL